jgi:hypothetical protein
MLSQLLYFADKYIPTTRDNYLCFQIPLMHHGPEKNVFDATSISKHQLQHLIRWTSQLSQHDFACLR